MTASGLAVVLLVAVVTGRIAWGVGRRRGIRDTFDIMYEEAYSAGYEGAAFDLKRALGRTRFLVLLDELKERQVEQEYESRRPPTWRRGAAPTGQEHQGA